LPPVAVQPSAGYCVLGVCRQARDFASVAVQPSACYCLLWLCSPARAIASCDSAAQRGLLPPVALQPSAGYGLLWLCSPARAMVSCGSAARRRLWPPRITRFLDHTQRRATVGRTPLDEWLARRRELYLTTHNKHPWPLVGSEPTIAAGERPYTYA
jgi:hypothetical protein